ncbi:MAG: ABC transporter ATP-binding protein [Verrucomicrobiota bacterium]
MDSSFLLEASGILRAYGDLRAVDQVSLSLEIGKVYSLIGQSGSGKTTLARILAGIDREFSGEIRLANDKRCVLVQQDFVVWPELTVVQNIAIGCRRKGDNARIISEIIEGMELGEKRSVKAGELSYGQRQRVAIGRAMATEADIIILDEPFAHLDMSLRRLMWERCIDVFKCFNRTSLWITHLVQDALPVVDRLYVMVDGRIDQSGVPKDIYYQPKSEAIAQLTGLCNVFETDDIERLQLEGYKPKDIHAGSWGCRPEHLSLVEDTDGYILGDQISEYFTGPITLHYISEELIGKKIAAVSGAQIVPEKRYRLRLKDELIPF